MAIIHPKLHHVTLRTSHLDEMLDWYGKVIGARVLFRNEAAAWTSNDEANHRVAFLAVPGLSDDPDKIGHNGLHHSAFEYSSFEDLMSSYARLRDEGLEPAFCLDHGMTISIYYRDPEGNFVELQSDCFSDWKLSTEFINASPDFAANPIGVFFDPAKVYAAHKEGVAFTPLHEGIRAERYLPVVIPNIGLPG
jgi:catechol-2,3-dioxygenase